LFNKAMVLHEAGRDQAALPLLREVERLRIDRVGANDPLLGDTARLLGETQAALGNDAQAKTQLSRAVQLTHEGYGSTHPHTRRAELSMALFELDQRANPAPDGEAPTDIPPNDDAQTTNAIVTRLDALAALPQGDPELRKIAWVAGAAAAATRCRQAERVDEREGEPDTLQMPQALDVLDALDAKVRAAMPQGGSVLRQFDRLRQTCR
jgi:eukaryotic-like serine/threonine-protein kinase